MDRLELLEAPPGADGDAGERALGEMDGHLRLVTEPLVQALQQCAPAREHELRLLQIYRDLSAGPQRIVPTLLEQADRTDDLFFGLGLAGTWRTLSRRPGPELREL